MWIKLVKKDYHSIRVHRQPNIKIMEDDARSKS